MAQGLFYWTRTFDLLLCSLLPLHNMMCPCSPGFLRSPELNLSVSCDEAFGFPFVPVYRYYRYYCRYKGRIRIFLPSGTGTAGELPINRIVDGKLKTDVVVAFGPLTLFNETRENVVLLCGRKMVVFWLLFPSFLSRQQAVSDSIHSIIIRPVSMSLQTWGLWLEFY